MKKLKFIGLFILPMLIFSCSTFEKFDQFGVGNTFDESFTVNIPQNSNMAFSGTVEFAASDDAIISDNLSDIQEFEVTQIGFKITNYVGNPEAVASGSFATTSDNINVGDSVMFSNLNFAQIFASEELMVLNLTSSTYDAIKTAYLNNQTLAVDVTGDIAGATEDLQIEFTVYMSIEATIGNQ